MGSLQSMALCILGSCIGSLTIQIMTCPTGHFYLEPLYFHAELHMYRAYTVINTTWHSHMLSFAVFFINIGQILTIS